jgi:hypothetical protein
VNTPQPVTDIPSTTPEIPHSGDTPDWNAARARQGFIRRRCTHRPAELGSRQQDPNRDHRDDRDTDHDQLFGRQDHAQAREGRAGVELIAEGGGPRDDEQPVGHDQAHGDGHDDHPEQLQASTREWAEDKAVEEQGYESRGYGARNKPEPDAASTSVDDVSSESSYRHHLAVCQVEDVGDRVLERKTNRRDGENGRCHQAESEEEPEQAQKGTRPLSLVMCLVS